MRRRTRRECGHTHPPCTNVGTLLTVSYETLKARDSRTVKTGRHEPCNKADMSPEPRTQDRLAPIEIRNDCHAPVNVVRKDPKGDVTH